MKRRRKFVVVCIGTLLTLWCHAGADTADDLVKGLKSPAPEVRVKAVEDFSAG